MTEKATTYDEDIISALDTIYVNEPSTLDPDLMIQKALFEGGTW